MKKIIKRLILIVLLAVLVVSGIFIFSGYREYRSAIATKSIQQSVEEYTNKPDYIKFDNLDEDFVNAVIAVEDKRFFEREGIDFIALTRAIIVNVTRGKLVEGGSTISQQIAKNLYFSNSLSFSRKVAEVLIMYNLESLYSKEELFSLYVNMNYYGDGYWGIQQAAMGYYQKNCDDLTIAQAAILAGIPNAPAVYQLSTGHELAVERQHKVLELMLENGFITQQQYEEALLEEV